jgi:predicted RNA-binding protein with PIN domain
MTVYVLLDGFNLAHYLFELAPLTPVTAQIDQPLIDVLGSWAARWGAEVELCFDPYPDVPEGNQTVKILIADPGHKADGLILYRLDYHSYQQERCLVVTSDRELQREVKERGGRCFSNRQFVKQVGNGKYSFASLPVSLPLGKLSALPGGKGQAISPAQPLSASRGRKPTSVHQLDIHQQTLAWIDSLRNETVAPVPNDPETDHEMDNRPPTLPQSPPKELRFRLTPRDWPIAAGIRFLVDSCCANHRGHLLDMLNGATEPSQVDMPFLAEMLVEMCGAEPDIILRGGSLMDRVRLALLMAGPSGLALSELAATTGDSAARIKQKLRQKQNRWVEILDETTR